MLVKDKNRDVLTIMVEQGHISAAQIADAKNALHLTSNEEDWSAFLYRLLLCLGIVSIALSVIFFIAANWQAMESFGKFALAQTAIIAFTGSYFIFQNKKLIAKVSLLALAISIGGFMALFGQIYQTGADPWQLFFNWALAIIPIVLISRFSVLYMLWMTLILVSAFLYLDLYYPDEIVLTSLLFISASFTIFSSLIQSKFTSLQDTWSVYVLGAFSTYMSVFVSFGGIFTIFDTESKSYLFALWLAWVIVMACFFVYLTLSKLILVYLSISIIITLNFLVFKFIDGDTIGAFLLAAIITISAGAGTHYMLSKISTPLRTAIHSGKGQGRNGQGGQGQGEKRQDRPKNEEDL